MAGGIFTHKKRRAVHPSSSENTTTNTNAADNFSLIGEDDVAADTHQNPKGTDQKKENILSKYSPRPINNNIAANNAIGSNSPRPSSSQNSPQAVKRNSISSGASNPASSGSTSPRPTKRNSVSSVTGDCTSPGSNSPRPNKRNSITSADCASPASPGSTSTRPNKLNSITSVSGDYSTPPMSPKSPLHSNTISPRGNQSLDGKAEWKKTRRTSVNNENANVVFRYSDSAQYDPSSTQAYSRAKQSGYDAEFYYETMKDVDAVIFKSGGGGGGGNGTMEKKERDREPVPSQFKPIK